MYQNTIGLRFHATIINILKRLRGKNVNNHQFITLTLSCTFSFTLTFLPIIDKLMHATLHVVRSNMSVPITIPAILTNNMNERSY